MTGSTHANHRSARSHRPTLEGPARDNPIAGPRTGTMRSEPTAAASAAARGRHKEPGSRPASTCPAQPPSESGGGEMHHGVWKADRSTGSHQTGRDAVHQPRATRHAREARCRPQPRHTNRCQATTATGCRKPGKRTEPAANYGTGTGARRHPTHTPHAPARSGGVQVERAHKHTHTPTPQPGVAERSRNPSPSTHNHSGHPSQEWRGTSRARTHTAKPLPGVVRRSRHPSPSTHIHTAHPSQESRNTSGARAQTDTHPNTPARSGGVQPKREPKHTHPHRSPSQEWRGTSGARTKTHTQPKTPARSGWAQPTPKPKHTHSHRTPGPGVAGYK